MEELQNLEVRKHSYILPVLLEPCSVYKYGRTDTDLLDVRTFVQQAPFVDQDCSNARRHERQQIEVGDQREDDGLH